MHRSLGMNRRSSAWPRPVAVAAVAGLLTAVTAWAASDVDSLTQLHLEVGRIAARGGGEFGVAALHVESGKRYSFAGRGRFPMASVYKLPVALEYLHRVEQGKASLDDLVVLRLQDFRPGGGPLDRRTGRFVTTMPARRLLEFALRESDNTAADALLRLAGGPAEVTARMRALGIDDIDVSRGEAELMADWSGVRGLPPADSWTKVTLREMFAGVDDATRDDAQRTFFGDARDTATPNAMVDLLAKIERRQALDPTHTDLLLGVLASAKTGPGRIKRFLPRGTVVAHKTGTLNGVTNDVGLIQLPGDRGHLALAIFVKASRRSEARRERAMAEIARLLYLRFMGP